MKRFLSVILVCALLVGSVLGLNSCSGSDCKKIEDRGYFVCGITVYEPMNYFDGEGALVGFDTEFAKAVADYLGVEAKFQVIDWPSKYMELESGSIDVIWNGFTLGAEKNGVSRTEYVDFTDAYLENRQCLVVKASDIGNYTSAASFAGKRAVVEGGSSGEAVAVELTGEANVKGFNSQASALFELDSNRADFAVIDYQMAKSMIGLGTDYADLAISEAVNPESEVYAIGCRKGSDFTAKINEAIAALYEDGTLAEIAAKYNLTNDLVVPEEAK